MIITILFVWPLRLHVGDGIELALLQERFVDVDSGLEVVNCHAFATLNTAAVSIPRQIDLLSMDGHTFDTAL